MKLAYQIIANGSDVTNQFQDRLTSITITDEAEQNADSLDIMIDDRDYEVALPGTGAKLDIAIGFVGDLTHMGTYVVDGYAGEIFPETFSITAKAADMAGEIKARKTRAWSNVSIADIIRKIAAEQGLKPQVSASLQAQFYPYLAQTSESDLNFLTRLARDLDAVAKPAGGSLLFVKRGEGLAANGAALPVFEIHRTQMESGRWSIGERGKYGRVVAEWAELGTAQVHKLTAGNKRPEMRLRHRYASQAEARRAAEGALKRGDRASAKISIELAGFWGDLMAEAKVDLQGIKPELAGNWLITKVTHTLTDTLKTRFEAERSNEEK